MRLRGLARRGWRWFIRPQTQSGLAAAGAAMVTFAVEMGWLPRVALQASAAGFAVIAALMSTFYSPRVKQWGVNSGNQLVPRWLEEDYELQEI